MREYNLTDHSLSRSLGIPHPHVSVHNKSTKKVSEEDELCIAVHTCKNMRTNMHHKIQGSVAQM